MPNRKRRTKKALKEFGRKKILVRIHRRKGKIIHSYLRKVPRRKK